MLKLTHVGEELVAEMFRRSSAVRNLMGTTLGLPVTALEAVTEAPLHTYGKLRFDGGTRIDVALLDEQNGTCIPCEAKLGIELMAKGSFERRFLKACSTSHKGTRVSGSMCAILDGKLPRSGRNAALIAKVDDHEYTVDARWGLVVRRSIATKWQERGAPSLSKRCSVVVFEDLVQAFGGAKKFNRLVQKLVGFDYFASWLMD